MKPGEVLIRAGEPNQSLYLVLSGRLRVHLDLSLDPIGELKPGEVAGEVSLISGELTSAYVVAEETSRLLVMNEKTMWSVLDSSPLASNLLLLIARRLYGADRVISKSEQLKHELDQYAINDALTGFYNRRWLANVLPRQMKRSKMSKQPLCLLVLHINSFEKHSDTYGRASSDRVLYAVSRTIRDSTRPGEPITRYGEVEFVVLLPDTDALMANKLGSRLCRSIVDTKLHAIDDKPLSGLTVSYGVGEMSDEDTATTLLSAAERDLHEARESSPGPGSS